MFDKKIYYVEYNDLDGINHIQIEARSKLEAEEIFKSQMGFHSIISIKTCEDIAEDISDKLMEYVREQFRKENLIK